MKTNKLSNRILLPMGLILSGALIYSGLLFAGCGGCPWTTTSDVTVTPNAECLEIAVAGGSGQEHSTGCVDPVIYGRNMCNTTLVLPAEYATDLQKLEVAPGESFDFEIDLQHCDDVGDRYDAVIPATLDDTEITISFSLYAP